MEESAKKPQVEQVEKVIKEVEQTYAGLKEKNPDKDEHWYLAHIWLERYGNSQEVKEKGKEWAEFTAYKDTYLFAVLDPPESVKGLGLVLAFKEAGEAVAKPYEGTLFEIMDKVMAEQENRTFFDKYREKNPVTWTKVSVPDDASYSLYWFFKGVELELEHGHELTDDVWGENDVLDKLEAEDKPAEAPPDELPEERFE